MEHKLIHKVKGAPDETRLFKANKGKMEVFYLGDLTVGRGEFKPGWRWSEHVKPIAKTPSCQATHTGYILEGRMVVKMDDGTETEYGLPRTSSVCQRDTMPGSSATNVA